MNDLGADRPGSPEVLITSRQSLFTAVGALWQYRELFVFLALRDVKIKYRQAVLGIAWAAIQPLVTMFLFAWLFSKTLGVGAAGQHRYVFYLSALIPWLFFSSAVTAASNSLVGNADMLRKVYFPRLVLPAASALAGLVELGIGFVVLVVLLGTLGLLSLKLLFWIPLVGLLFLFSLAVGAFLAAVNARYRDVKHTVPFLLQVWLFVSPVIYPVAIVPERFRSWVSLNPMVGILGAFRATTTPSATLDVASLVTAVGSTIVLSVVAGYYFLRTEAELADVV